jgi:hypothetical protein
LLAKQGTQALLAQAFEIGPVFYSQLSELGSSDLAVNLENQWLMAALDTGGEVEERLELI